MTQNTERKNKEQDKTSIRLKFKKFRILFGYYRKNIRRKINLSYILFAFSIFMFFLILIPNSVHRLPLPSEGWPLVLELHGTVVLRTNDTGQQTLIPIAFATIEIGGYRTMTDLDGRFHVRFVSQTENNIPVLIEWNNNSRIQRVSFEQGSFEKNVILIIE